MSQLNGNIDGIDVLIVLVGMVLLVALLRLIHRDYGELIRGGDRRKSIMVYNFPIMDGNGMIITEERRKSHDRRKHHNAI